MDVERCLRFYGKQVAEQMNDKHIAILVKGKITKTSSLLFRSVLPFIPGIYSLLLRASTYIAESQALKVNMHYYLHIL